MSIITRLTRWLLWCVKRADLATLRWQLRWAEEDLDYMLEFGEFTPIAVSRMRENISVLRVEVCLLESEMRALL